MTPKANHRQGGFTVVEIIIAIVLLTVGLLSMTGLQSTARGSNASSKLQSGAITLAEEKLVQLNNLGYAGLTNTGWTAVENVTLTGVGTFSRQYQISDSVASYLKYIQVRVTWTGMKSVSKQVDLATYLAKS